MEEDRCRLCNSCGSNNSDLHDIFVMPTVKEKIKDLLHIFVCADDFLPKMVCTECTGRLDCFGDFVRKCQSSQEKLLQLQSARGRRTTETAVQTEVFVPNADDEEMVPTLKDESPQAPNVLKEELSDDERENDIPLVYLSDDSYDRDYDRDNDSDIEFVTEPFPFSFPMPKPATELDQKMILVSANEDSSFGTVPEFKPELRNGRLVFDRHLQVGSSYFEEYKTIFEKIQRENPQIPATEFRTELKRKSQRGTAISTNIGLHKGCQIEITIGVRHQSRHRWNTDQKRQMQMSFQHHYTNYEVPRKKEVLKFLSKMNDDSFRDISCHQVTRFFTNRRAYVNAKRLKINE